ncbi:MAG TPA: sulfotransferase [Prosthecobacter sp.]|nr:sulfotransferase [Prosthecobacter sp.]HRK13199.1 sulfotransferase [Prosthecobacter sp.]
MSPLHLPGGKTAPDLFIIGGARCGSTSLHYYLDQHPGVHMCQPDKEPSYYCDVYGVKDPEEYAANFAGAAPGQLLGDASTPYLTCPASAGLIHAANPGARIIVILRQPADRAYSLYLKMCSLGHETAPDFETALELEKGIVNDPPEWRREGYHYNHLYFHSGLYAEQLRRFHELFPKEQIFHVIFDDLTVSPQKLCAEICAWLGLPAMPAINPEPRNRAVRPRSLKFQHWLRHSLNPALKKTRLPWRGQILEKLLAWNTDPSPAPKLDAGLRRRLTERYAEDIQATAALIGRDLGRWLR